jgi:hypothetical protein
MPRRRSEIGLPPDMSRDDAYVAGVADGEKSKQNRMSLSDDELGQISRLISQEADRVTNLAFMEPVTPERIEAARWWRTLANRFRARLDTR